MHSSLNEQGSVAMSAVYGLVLGTCVYEVCSQTAVLIRLEGRMRNALGNLPHLSTSHHTLPEKQA